MPRGLLLQLHLTIKKRKCQYIFRKLCKPYTLREVNIIKIWSDKPMLRTTDVRVGTQTRKSFGKIQEVMPMPVKEYREYMKERKKEAKAKDCKRK